jgi:excisionase family DNA binding protein
MTSDKTINKGSKKTHGIVKPPRQRLYNLRAAAEYLGRPVWGIRELVWAGKLPVVKDGRKQYVDIQDMDRYIERNKVITP